MTKNNAAVVAMILGAGLCFVGTFAGAGTPRAAPRDAAMDQYLQCINSSAKQQQTKGSDRLANPQAVLSSCSDQKATLLKARPDAGTARLVARIEQHVKSRQKR